MRRLRAAMPGDLPARPYGWRFAVLGITAIALQLVMRELGAWSRYTSEQRGDAWDLFLLMACELAVVTLFWRARFRTSLAVRAGLVAAITCVPALGLFVLSSLGYHGPRYVAPPHLPDDSFVAWFGETLLWSFVLAIGVPIAHAIRGRKPTS